MKIRATLKTINPRQVIALNKVGYFHTNNDKVNDYADMLRAGKEPPPILIARSRKNSVFVLDGFHRLESARIVGRRIKAWVVRYGDLNRLIKAKFRGFTPEYYCDMDEYIACGRHSYKWRVGP